MSEPLVSIVLPCWNGAKLLPRAVRSCLSQTLADFELIIVNDCSTDNTLETAEALAKTDSRIRVVSNEKNSKLPATLNHGFSLARGKYLTWTSDDNEYLPAALERMVCVLEDTQSDLVYADFDVVDLDGNVLEEKKLLGPDRLYEYNWVGACFLYRREVYDTLGGYRIDLFCAEDYEYWLRICSAGMKMTHISERLYLYAENPCSLTATKRDMIAERTALLKLEYVNRIQAPRRIKAKALYRLYRKCPMKQLAKEIIRQSPIIGWLKLARYWLVRR